MKLNRRRIFAGMALGAVNLATGWLAVIWALRNGILGPSSWYDMPIVLALMLGPAAGWCIWLARKAWKSRGSGGSVLIKVLHGVAYVSSLPAGSALAFMVLSAVL